MYSLDVMWCRTTWKKGKDRLFLSGQTSNSKEITSDCCTHNNEKKDEDDDDDDEANSNHHQDDDIMPHAETTRLDLTINNEINWLLNLLLFLSWTRFLKGKDQHQFRLLIKMTSTNTSCGPCCSSSLSSPTSPPRVVELTPVVINDVTSVDDQLLMQQQFEEDDHHHPQDCQGCLEEREPEVNQSSIDDVESQWIL